MRKEILCFATVIILFSGCADNHLIVENKYRSKVHDSFLERRQLVRNRNRELFSVFEKGLSQSRKEALEFLYAYMPLSDLADYDGDFFLSNADIALRTRKESSWGKNIPDNIFYTGFCRSGSIMRTLTHSGLNITMK